MPQLYTISTLLYCFNERGEVLLLKRKRPPNLGLWSPPGGKLDTVVGESPFQSAAREGTEELGIVLSPSEFHLTGIVSEQSDQGNWLMFLFELLRPLKSLPEPHAEGEFCFFRPETVDKLDLPLADKEKLWPLFWKNRRGFFAAHCHLRVEQSEWTVCQELRKP